MMSVLTVHGVVAERQTTPGVALSVVVPLRPSWCVALLPQQPSVELFWMAHEVPPLPPVTIGAASVPFSDRVAGECLRGRVVPAAGDADREIRVVAPALHAGDIRRGRRRTRVAVADPDRRVPGAAACHGDREEAARVRRDAVADRALQLEAPAERRSRRIEQAAHVLTGRDVLDRGERHSRGLENLHRHRAVRGEAVAEDAVGA